MRAGCGGPGACTPHKDAQTHTHLTACTVVQVAPVKALGGALVIGVHKLVLHDTGDLVQGTKVVVAEYDFLCRWSSQRCFL